jgi:hypothetical protein
MVNNRKKIMKTYYSFLLISLFSLITPIAYATESSADQYVEHVIIQQGAKPQSAFVSSDLTIIQTGSAINRARQSRSAFILMEGANNRVSDIARARIEQSTAKK